MAPKTIQDSYKYVDGVLNLFKFDFVNVKNCFTSIKGNLWNNIPTDRSVSEIVTCPYQGLFIYFDLFSQISYDKIEKVIPLSWENIESINRETA